MAISGHRSQVSLKNYIGHPSREQFRACSGVLSNALSGRPHQSLQPSFNIYHCVAHKIRTFVGIEISPLYLNLEL